MSAKGPTQVGTQNTSSIDPRATAQAPYLQQSWDTARNTLNTQPLNPQGYGALWGAAGGSNVTGAPDFASQPFVAGTTGQYGGQYSPAYGGYQTVAAGGTPGQQLAQQGAGWLNTIGSQSAATGAQFAAPITNLAGQSAATGQQYGNLIGQTAAGTQAAVADPMAMMRQQASGYYLNSNPYLDQMYGNAADAVRSNYQTATDPRTQSSYEGAGRYGSPSAQNAISQNQQNLGRTLDTLAGNIYGQNYATERGLQNTATANLGNLGLSANQQTMQGYNMAGNQALAGLGQGISGYNTAGNQQLAGYGQAGNQYAQAGNLGLSNTGQQIAGLGGLQGGYQAGNATALNAAGMLPQIQAGYTYGPQQQVAAIQGLAQQPWDQLRNYSSIINAQNPFQATQSQAPIYGSPIGQTLGGLGSLASGIGSIASLIPSDRRLKEDTQIVGRVGRLPVHLFKYKGDPTPRLGFMADEVEKIDPSAVMMTNLGFKAVNYGRAAASALQE